MPAKLGPRVNRPDKKASAAENRVRVMVKCASRHILRELEDEAQIHVIACLLYGAKLNP